MVPAAPSAAASVGVAQPAVMAPTTMPKISTSGSTWTRNGTQRATPAGPSIERFLRRERGIEPGAQDDVADEQHAQDQARHDAADQQARDRNAGEAAEQHRERRRRDQHVDAADAHDRAHGEALVVAALEHGRQHQAAEQRGGGDGRAGDRREHRAGDDGDDREPARHPADQQREGVDRLQRHAGVKQHLAHQHEERNRRQREARHRLHGVARELRQPLLAAEEQQRADDVDGEEAERDRQARGPSARRGRRTG